MLQKTFGSLVLAGVALSSIIPQASANISAANTLASQGVISESSDYRLGDTITRKEMMKIVMNLSGKNVPDTCNGTFSDVSNDWGCKYIEAALANGFIASNATFRPDDTITKAESIKLALGARGISKANDTGDWQADWMNTAYANSLLDTTYTDHNTKALRGWIFGLGANPITARLASETVASDQVAQQEITTVAGVYTDYSPELIGKNEDTVLFFYAAWCPTCRTAETNILNDDISSTDISILKVDFDNSTELRKKYRVTTQHTFVQVDENGEFIKSWLGSNTLDAIIAKLK